MAKPTNSTNQTNIHPALHNVVHDVKNMYGGAFDGTTDDTAAVVAAITAAAADGTKALLFPAGTCIADGAQIATALGSAFGWRFYGAGKRATIIKAKAGATYGFAVTGGQRLAFYDMSFYGRGSGSSEGGFLSTGNAQAFTFIHCSFEQAAIGGSFQPNGGSNQNDKHTFIGCTAADNNIGMDFNSTNGQGHVWVGGSFDSNSVSCRLQWGWFSMYGGMVQHSGGTGTAFEVGGAAGAHPAQALTLDGVITESENISIDVIGMAVPATITLRNTYLQGQTYTVRLTGSPKVFSEGSTFNNGAFDGGSGSAIWYSREDMIGGLGGSTGTYTPGSLTIRYVELGSNRSTYVGSQLNRVVNSAGWEDRRVIPSPASPATNYVRLYVLNSSGKWTAKDSAGTETALY